jgi:hypothetical protein
MNWNDVIANLGSGNPEDILEQVARASGSPPIGKVSRELLIAWSRCSGGLRGGTFRCVGGGGFGLNGIYDQPFLSSVIGHRERAKEVINDLLENAPDAATAVFKKIYNLGSHAKSKIDALKGAGMPPQGKAMFAAVFSYGAALLELIPEHLSEKFRMPQFSPADSAPDASECPEFESTSGVEQEWKIKSLRECLQQTEFKSVAEISDFMDAVEYLHSRADSDKTTKGLGEWIKLETQLFGNPAIGLEKHEDYGLGFRTGSIDGADSDLLDISGLRYHDQLNRIFDRKNWQDVLNECTEAEYFEIGETEFGCTSEIEYWVYIPNPIAFAREIRELLLKHAIAEWRSDWH